MSINYSGLNLAAIPCGVVKVGHQIQHIATEKVLTIRNVIELKVHTNGSWDGVITYDGTRGLMIDIKPDQFVDFNYLGKKKSWLERVHDFMKEQIDIARGLK